MTVIIGQWNRPHQILARRIHSRGSSGGSRLFFIIDSTVAEGGMNHKERCFPIALNFFRCHYHGVDPDFAREITVIAAVTR